MTTPTITLIETGHVRFSLDMTQYCQAYQALILSEQKSEPGVLNELQRQFYECREDLEDWTTSISGELLWKEIKEKLAQNLTLHGLDSNSDPSSIPLVIEVLDATFVELLKNSMDACLKHNLSHPQATSMLEMNIQLEIKEDSITCIITDNGPGFSEAFLEDFETYVHQKQYQNHDIQSEKAQDSEYYFGGAGVGMRIICNYLLDGRRSLEEQEAFYDLSKGGNALQIQTQNGAQIKLTTLLAPYPQLCAPGITRSLPFRFSIPEKKSAAAPRTHSSASTSFSFDSLPEISSDQTSERHPFAPHSPLQSPLDQVKTIPKQTPLPSHLKYIPGDTSSSFFHPSPETPSSQRGRDQSGIINLEPGNSPKQRSCCF